MSTTLPRFDMWADYGHEIHTQADAEGVFVYAQDAYDKVASLEAEIAILKTQLKDAKRARTV